MTLSKPISDLLYRYQCVTIPGFGAFITNYQPAKHNSADHSFSPPSKQLTFNSQLVTNDGLLASYIAECNGISFENAMDRIEEQIKLWWKELDKNEDVVLEKVGALNLNAEGNLIFTPANTVNYLTASFGLSSFTSPAVNREVYKQEAEALENSTPLIITPERRSQSPILRYAAVGLFLVALGFGVKEINDKNRDLQQVVGTQTQEIVEDSIQTATFFDTAPMELPTISINIAKKEIKKYFVVAGAFRVKNNATKKINQLIAQGYEAELIGTNRYGLHQVSFAGFADKDEALASLREIKRNVTREAWLLTK
ncbi:HU domain-containing protein [Spongiivirga citrea]|uniref:SPOR domain-containing protein n=1 Tax=Spongiivirga citrea TaxID=1481457 RepID=A0A6M0CJ77_9FLAO|nr:SPOR domain-containing protein [Spongiivirga citrea]NER17986.1 SPOR domain-containing protein [Spongiivirga citrea]